MYCRYCGKELKPNARFCTFCGKEQVKMKPKTAVDPAAIRPATPPVNTQPVRPVPVRPAVPPVNAQPVNTTPVQPNAKKQKVNAAALVKERMAAGKERIAAGREQMAAGREKVSAASVKGMRIVLIGLACAMCVAMGVILLLDPYSFISITGA